MKNYFKQGKIFTFLIIYHELMRYSSWKQQVHTLLIKDLKLTGEIFIRMGFVHNFGLFLLGIRDSLSLGWVHKLIFCTDPITQKTHPATIALRKSLASALLRVGLSLFVIPLLLKFLGIDSIALLFRVLFLVLSYGYIFFYNQEIMDSTRKIIAFRKRELKENHFELDTFEKIDPFLYLSGVIKGILFLVLYYVPVMIITTLLTFVPYLGMFLVIVSQAFFNASFFFLTAWPYDNYNAAFLQKQKYYLLGFGMFISIVCNYYLSGFTSLGVCLIISLWMLMNIVIYSPVEKPDGQEFNSFAEVWSMLLSSQQRNRLKNAYNLHRQKLRKDKSYGQKMVKSVFWVKPALIITDYVNILIGRLFFKTNPKPVSMTTS